MMVKLYLTCFSQFFFLKVIYTHSYTYMYILLLKANLLLLIIQQWKSYTSPSSIITMN